MDPQQQHDQARGRSPSAGAHLQHTPHINHRHSPSPSPRPFHPTDALGLGLDASSQQLPPDYPSYDDSTNAFLNPQSGLAQDLSFDPSQAFTDQLNLAQQPSFTDDFTIFPASAADQQLNNAPLFVGDGATPDMNAMATPHHSPTPPHLLQPEPHQPGSAHQSPSFNQHQFSSSPAAGRHSRNASLAPEAALLPHQDWSQAQFQGHRRTPSEYSDVSSVGARSPALVGADTFSDQIAHSPMQRPQDAGIYQELHGIGSFSISDQGPPSRGRSPSHSPAISPRILPQSLPDMGQPGGGFMLQAQNNNGFGGQHYLQAGPPEAFPQLPQSQDGTDADMSQMMSAPTIFIDTVPTAARSGFESKSVMDTDALIPPDQRGMQHLFVLGMIQAC